MKFKFILIMITLLTFIFSQTDSQISKAKEIIKKSGMSESQVINAAKAQGYSDKQIKNAINKEKSKIKSENQSNDATVLEALPIESLDNTDLSNTVNDEKREIDKVQDADDSKEKEISIDSEIQPQQESTGFFGYDIFKQDPELFQASSVGGVDPDYLIGPGDEIIVMLWGETQFRQVFKVNREGFVFIPDIGQVFVNGLTLNLLESKLFKVLGKYYSSLNNQGTRPATTFLDVSLGNLRPLRIQVLGEVAQPGAYTVSPSATLFSAMYYFNGPTTLGSLRDIRLIRGGKEISSIDFYEYLLSGKKPKDEKLQLDDIIFIPKRKKSVTIYGEINRPATYELKDNESLDDLLKVAGGKENSASASIFLYRDNNNSNSVIKFF